MPIKGLTNRGLSFPEIGQIRNGAKKTKNAPGKDLEYFRVVFGESERAAKQKFIDAYGDKPTAIRIILPFNDIDQMWSAYLEAYTAGRMVAKSDGEFILYQSNSRGDVIVKDGFDVATGQRVPHPADNVAGEDFKGKPVYFKESGRLRVIVPELERAAYMLVLTTSKHDCANIDNQLRAFQSLNSGQIAGIPFILRKSPLEISKPIDGKRVRSTSWLLSIEADPTWVKARLGVLKQTALPEVEILEIEESVIYDEVEEEIEDAEIEAEVITQAEQPKTNYAGEEAGFSDLPDGPVKWLMLCGVDHPSNAASIATKLKMTNDKEEAMRRYSNYRNLRDDGKDSDTAAEMVLSAEEKK